MEYTLDPEFPGQLDNDDELRKFRKQFHIPEKNNKKVIYFAGNSLGLQPVSTRNYLETELSSWASLGVEGHFKGENPWFHYHKFTKNALARLAGGTPLEVVAMNHLTTNLHLLLISFYQPESTRYKIITEYGSFPSDQYALESQVRFHGYDPEDAIIEVKPRQGEYVIRTEDILDTIDRFKDEACLVIMSGLQFYTGQFFNLKEITRAAHKAGMYAGFDLAHAIGNVNLDIHDQEVDFAVWCSYKYLNGGPGGLAGAFVHQRHADNTNLPRLAGWWGHNEETRFQPQKKFEPMKGVDGWQLSNVNILSAAALWASLNIFEEAGLSRLYEKSKKLTGYLEFLIKTLPEYSGMFRIITPEDPVSRGCQLSLHFSNNGEEIYERLITQGIVVDWREPAVMRVTPVPLYNTYKEVYRFYRIFKSSYET